MTEQEKNDCEQLEYLKWWQEQKQRKRKKKNIQTQSRNIDLSKYKEYGFEKKH